MNYWNAFWVGGTICAVCQIFIDRTKLTPARILVALVVAGVFLEAVGIAAAVTFGCLFALIAKPQSKS